MAYYRFNVDTSGKRKPWPFVPDRGHLSLSLCRSIIFIAQVLPEIWWPKHRPYVQISSWLPLYGEYIRIYPNSVIQPAGKVRIGTDYRWFGHCHRTEIATRQSSASSQGSRHLHTPWSATRRCFGGRWGPLRRRRNVVVMTSKKCDVKEK